MPFPFVANMDWGRVPGFNALEKFLLGKGPLKRPPGKNGQAAHYPTQERPDFAILYGRKRRRLIFNPL
jgi:hypothetical protein